MNKKKILFLVCLLGFILLLIFALLLFKKDFKIELEGNSNISINVNDKFEPKLKKACYGNIFTCSNVKYDVKGKVDNTKLGTYKIKYQVKYKNKTKSINQTIKVVDKKSPSLTVSNENELTICPNGKIKNYEYKALDNLDGDITDKVEIKVEYDKLVFEVKDSANNITKKTYDYKKEDKENPTINLNGNSDIYILVGENFSDEGVTTSDNCDEDLKDKVRVNGSVNSNSPGKYTINYEVTDEAGMLLKLVVMLQFIIKM